MKDWQAFISQYDLIYGEPPSCWQDGVVMGNGNLGAVFFAQDSLEWLVNKTDVLDSRTRPVKRIIPFDEAREMVRRGAPSADFEREELKSQPEGIGPKTCCRLKVDLGMGRGEALPGIYSRLSLYDATLRVALDKHLCHPRAESFVRADEDMLVVRVSDVSPLVAFKTGILFSRPEDIQLETPELCIDRNRLVMRVNMPGGENYVAGLQIVPGPETVYRRELLSKLREKYHPPVMGDVKLRVNGCHGSATAGGNFTIFLTVVTNRDTDDPLAEMHRRLDRAASSEYDELRASHATWWEKFWQKSWVELGDKAQEQLFYHSLYTLGSAYRKAPLSGLCGLCYGPGFGHTQVTPWTGDLHHDLNVQCPFFPVHALNHSELFDAYLETYDAFLPEARRLAKDVWGINGAHFDMCFNARGRSVLGGVGKYRYFFGGSYVGLMHCLCWKYRRDPVQLRETIYPFLKEILEFYQHMMKKGDDGRYHIRPAHAVELDIMDCADPVQTISMLRICLETALEGAAILDTDENLTARWKDMLDHLPEYSMGIDARGREVVVDGVGIPPDHHVGQAGCLHPVYPCGEVDEFSAPQTIALYDRTLDSVVDKTAQKVYAADGGFHYRCVWQCFFRAMTALRLGRSEEFWTDYLPMFLRTYSKPNGLVSHDAAVIVDPDASEANLETIPDDVLLDVDEKMPVFEPWHGSGGGSSPNPRAKEFSIPLVEGNADYLTMMTETLLQSHNGIIRVFPGWPSDRNAQFVNLVAEGGFTVSSRFIDGTVQFIKIGQQRYEGNHVATSVHIKSPWTGKVQKHNLPDNGELVIGRRGVQSSAPAQESATIEAARPRVLYEDRHCRLWLGRQNTSGSMPSGPGNSPLTDGK